MKNISHSVVIWAVVAVAMSTQHAAAQSTVSRRGKIPVTVVLPATEVANRLAIAISRDPATGYQVVLRPSEATPENVFQAMATIAALLDRDGDYTRDRQVIHLRPTTEGPPNEVKISRRALNRLRASPEHRVPGVGRARTVVILLPNSTSRAARRASRNRPAR